MTGNTAATSKDALAQKHLRRQLVPGQRTGRQRARLALLQLWGRRYPAPVARPGPSPARILVIRPDHLGDLLFATPALHWLRRRFAKAHISLLVGPWGEAVFAGNEDVDQVLTCPFPGFTRQPKDGLWEPYQLLRPEADRLRSSQFDLALILRFDHWWGAWLAAEAGIPWRLGYDWPETRPFLTQPVPYVPGRHEVLQNAALALAADPGNGRRIGTDLIRNEQAARTSWQLRYQPSMDDQDAAQRLLAPVAGRRLMAVHPGSGAAVKHWRAEAWAQVCQELARRYQAQVLLTGSADESRLIEPILELLDAGGKPGGGPAVLRPVSLAGQTSLGTLAAVYEHCGLVIGPDSGPLHLAVAMGTPTVHLYGPVDRRTFGPWANPSRHRVITSDWACVPCNRLDWPPTVLHEHGCVRDVSVEQVLAEVEGVVNGRWLNG